MCVTSRNFLAHQTVSQNEYYQISAIQDENFLSIIEIFLIKRTVRVRELQERQKLCVCSSKPSSYNQISRCDFLLQGFVLHTNVSSNIFGPLIFLTKVFFVSMFVAADCQHFHTYKGFDHERDELKKDSSYCTMRRSMMNNPCQILLG